MLHRRSEFIYTTSINLVTFAAVIYLTLLFPIVSSIAGLYALSLEHKYHFEDGRVYDKLRNRLIMITAVMLFLSGVVTYSDGVIKKNQWQAERDKLDSLKSARENPGKDDDGKVEKLMARNQELDSLLLPFLTMTKKRYPKLGQREGLNKLRINLGDPTLLPPQGASGSNTTVNSTFAIPAKLNVQWKTVNEKIDSFVVDNPPPVKTIKLPADEFPFPAVYRSVFVLSYFTPDLRQLRMKLKREDVVQYRVMRESGGSVDQSATKESGHGHTVSLQSPSNGRYVVEYVTVERINPGADLIFEE